MANSEISVNDKIADVLRSMNSDWRTHDHVSSENTHGLAKKKALRPDILIIEPGVPTVCIETEYSPGLSVEADAASRIGEIAVKSGTVINTCLAVRIPARFKTTTAPKLLKGLHYVACEQGGKLARSDGARRAQKSVYNSKILGTESSVASDNCRNDLRIFRRFLNGL